MTVCVVTLRKFPPFVEPNVISHGPTNGLSIRHLKVQRAIKEWMPAGKG